MSEYIFDESLISTEIQDALSPNLKLRPLAKNDFDKGLSRETKSYRFFWLIKNLSLASFAQLISVPVIIKV